jgi:TolB-like protein
MIAPQMSKPQVQRRLAAILAADVVGYSRLVGRDEEGTLAAFKAHLSELVEPAIASRRGRIVKTTGDGLLVEFGSAVEAVRCAIDVQRGMTERNVGVPPEKHIAFRIGVNVGDIVIDGDDILGDGVNIAARLEGLAEPGGVLVSHTVHDQVRDRLDLAFDDLGERDLKNIARRVRVFAARGLLDPEAAREAAPAGGDAMPVPDKPSIAVLPFDNMSDDAEQAYFADGVVEDIITGLSRLRWLFVIARNSSFTYKGRTVDIRQVGRELGVRYVLEGSVRKGGDRIRVTGQLIEAETGNHLWAERYDRSLADVFAIQDEITTNVVAAIEPNVRKAEIARAKRKRPSDLGAYDLYLRALEQAWAYTPAGRSAALEYLEAAFEQDRGYPEAHGLAAWCLQQRFLWGGRRPEDRTAALEHARFVAAANTDDATTLAFAAFAMSALAGDHEQSLPMIDRALTQNSNSAIAHSIKALVETIRGHPAASEDHARKALRLSPFDPLRYLPEISIAGAKLMSGLHDDALEHARRALEANPVFAPALNIVAVCQVRLGKIADAQATVRRLVAIAPDTRVATLRERFLFSDALGFDSIAADLVSAGLPE